jgi:nitrite reductase/ring-hydroxylating ferredoxin subunit
MNTPTWHTTCVVDDIKEGMRVIEIGRRKVTVTRIDDRFFAFDNYCPHVAGPMHRGELNSAIVTCPLHGWRFDLEREGAEVHGYRPLTMFPIREEDGNLLIWL